MVKYMNKWFTAHAIKSNVIRRVTFNEGILFHYMQEWQGLVECSRIIHIMK